MGKNQEVEAAVRKMLVKENNPAPVTGQEKLGDTYGYDSDSIRGLLGDIREWLGNDSPSFVFNPELLKPDDCVAATVIQLDIMIANVTKPA